VQTEDEESALASMIGDQPMPKRALRRKPAAKAQQGLSKEMISLCAAGAVIALLALIWLASNALSPQKHGWDTYSQELNEGGKHKAEGGKNKADASRTKGDSHAAAPRRKGEVPVARPAGGSSSAAARPVAPAVAPGPRRGPAVEDQGEAIAAPVTNHFPAATHNPLGDFGPGAQLPPAAGPAAVPNVQPPAGQQFPPVPTAEDAPPDDAVGRPK
jgi:hypothetical protein